MSTALREPMTLDEFLAREGRQDLRYEYQWVSAGRRDRGHLRARRRHTASWPRDAAVSAAEDQSPVNMPGVALLP